jgi:hypothetical protein
MNQQEKLQLARQLEKLGVDIIEAGFPASSEGDREAVSEIARVVKNARVVGLARTAAEDIETAWRSVENGNLPGIHTFIATSDIHLEQNLECRATRSLTVPVRPYVWPGRYPTGWSSLAKTPHAVILTSFAVWYKPLLMRVRAPSISPTPMTPATSFSTTFFSTITVGAAASRLPLRPYPGSRATITS